MRRLMVAGNWKMNGSQAMIDELIPALNREIGSTRAPDVDVVVCPPSIYLQAAGASLGLGDSGAISLGAQNCSEQESGAFTGETSTRMLAEIGCQYVIVGHSERRALYAESDELIGDKAKAVLSSGMVPIICLGETLEEREAGDTEQVVGRQLNAVTAVIGSAGLSQSVLAYEPVWAIGTGKTASGEQAQQVHAYLRSELTRVDAQMAAQTRILYGGSVKGDNAADLFAQPDIDGGLIGGASLKAPDFLAIVFATT